MRAVTWQGKRNVSVENVPDPAIQQQTDAIIRVTSSAICGSDLHLYEIMAPFMEQGDIMGHEPMGIVEEVGTAVTSIKRGDRVVVPFNIACGKCSMCLKGLTTQCETTRVDGYGRGAAMFGYTKLYGHVPGGQAEYLRVPHADFMAKKVPESGSDDRYLYLSDVLPTAWQAVKYADVPKNESVVVVGLGPIGDMATRVARHLGAKNVFGLDLVPERLARAEANGVTAIDIRQFDNDHKKLAKYITEKNNGKSPTAVVEAVGSEAHGSLGIETIQKMTNLLPDTAAEKVLSTVGIDRMTALNAAVEIIGRGGTLSIAGLYVGQADPISMDTLFDKHISIRMGQANAPHLTPEILPLLEKENVFDVDNFATHHLPLEEAPRAYEIFQKKEDGAIKIILQP